MKLLKSDISHNFMIGFVAGAVIIVSQFSPEFAMQLVPQALASISL